MLAMLVARPMSVEPSSSSWVDGVGDALADSRLTDAANGSLLTSSDLRPTGAWGREEGEVSFRGRSTIYFCVSQRNHAMEKRRKDSRAHGQVGLAHSEGLKPSDGQPFGLLHRKPCNSPGGTSAG